MKILVIKRDKIGDLLLTTPLIGAIRARYPQAEIHVLANTYNGWVVENNPDMDRLWRYPIARGGKWDKLAAVLRQFAQALRLRREGYDWIIVAGGEASERANRRARAIAGSGTRIVAYCDSGQSAGISDPLAPPTAGHEVERILALAEPLGVKPAPGEVPLPRFAPSQAWIDSARGFLAAANLAPGGYVMLGIGARSRKRQPTPAQILRWTRLLHEQHGLHTVFQWTPGKPDDPLYPGDDDIAEAVLDEGNPWLHPYRGGLDTGVGLVWLARASLFPDSGLMHLAAASPGGVVGLFADIAHSPSPAVWGPRGERVQVLVAEHSIADLSDERVFAALAGVW